MGTYGGKQYPDFCTYEGCDKPFYAKGYCTTHYKRLRKHGDVNVVKRAQHGAGNVNGKGYRMIERNGAARGEHVLIAEAALGKPLPAGAEVHHVDGNKLNNTPSNLVICQSHAYHCLLHKRQRALDACGNARAERCVYCKGYGNPEEMVSWSSNLKSGKQQWTFRHARCKQPPRRSQMPCMGL